MSVDFLKWIIKLTEENPDACLPPFVKAMSKACGFEEEKVKDVRDLRGLIEGAITSPGTPPLTDETFIGEIVSSVALPGFPLFFHAKMIESCKDLGLPSKSFLVGLIFDEMKELSPFLVLANKKDYERIFNCLDDDDLWAKGLQRLKLKEGFGNILNEKCDEANGLFKSDDEIKNAKIQQLKGDNGDWVRNKMNLQAVLSEDAAEGYINVLDGIRVASEPEGDFRDVDGNKVGGLVGVGGGHGLGFVASLGTSFGSELLLRVAAEKAGLVKTDD
ncbi:MAG: hypothetical protein LBH47_00080, partial [Christensenellaceae bacterium]|nr:hypothetical protein [Christensenellaceae bacterium]